MALLIQRTGLEQYGAQGTAKLKALIIGGPGKGKTAWASTWPKPIYADVEGGLASVAHKKVPFATINNSSDMMDILQFLKLETQKPAGQRDYDTLIVDTLDAYQRKLKTEWMVKNRAESFTGFEAWNYLATKCGALMTRLLNLDMNIIVNVHYKDKVVQSKDGDATREVSQFMLQLQGETADTVFNDFDLVGWMDTDWEPVDGKRSQVRYLTFRATPDKPFLKDRLNITPDRMKITFDDGDYRNLFSRLEDKIKDLSPGESIGEIPNYDSAPTDGVVAPNEVGNPVIGGEGPKAGGDLTSFDKATLLQIARDEGVTATADGQPIKGNTIKSELILAIRSARDAKAGVPAQVSAPYAENLPAQMTPAAPDNVVPLVTEPVAPTPTEPAEPAEPVLVSAPVDEPQSAPVRAAASALQRQREAVAAREPAAPSAEVAADPATGEVPDGAVGPEGSTQAVRTAEELLGAQVIAEPAPEPTPPPAPVAPAPVAAAQPPTRRGGTPDLSSMECAVCGKNLGAENPDYVKLSMIKFRKPMCQADYAVAKR